MVCLFQFIFDLALKEDAEGLKNKFYPTAHFMNLSTVRRYWPLMCFCVVILSFSSIFFFLKNCYRSITVDFITFVVGAFQSFLKGVFTLLEDFLVISESISYFVFRFLAGSPYPFFFYI